MYIGTDMGFICKSYFETDILWVPVDNLLWYRYDFWERVGYIFVQVSYWATVRI